jgi:hypothetical protein
MKGSKAPEAANPRVRGLRWRLGLSLDQVRTRLIDLIGTGIRTRPEIGIFVVAPLIAGAD